MEKWDLRLNSSSTWCFQKTPHVQSCTKRCTYRKSLPRDKEKQKWHIYENHILCTKVRKDQKTDVRVRKWSFADLFCLGSATPPAWTVMWMDPLRSSLDHRNREGCKKCLQQAGLSQVRSRPGVGAALLLQSDKMQMLSKPELQTTQGEQCSNPEHEDMHVLEKQYRSCQGRSKALCSLVLGWVKTEQPSEIFSSQAVWRNTCLILCAGQHRDTVVSSRNPKHCECKEAPPAGCPVCQ